MGRDFLEIIDRQPLTAVQELFSSELVRLLLLFKISLFGTVLYDQLTTRSPMGALIRGFDLVANYQVAEGGSIAVAYGLMHTFAAAGGELKTGAHVSKIIVDANQARGVELADGTQIRSRFVASTVDVPQTFVTMVGEEQLPEAYREKVRAFKQTAWSLFGLHLALKEAPRHVGTDFDPHVNQSLKVNIGCESVEQLFALHDQVAAQRDPEPGELRHRLGHPVRSVAGPAGHGHRLRLARHAVRPRRRPGEHRGGQGGVRRPHAGDLAGVGTQHHPGQRPGPAHLDGQRLLAGADRHGPR